MRPTTRSRRATAAKRAIVVAESPRGVTVLGLRGRALCRSCGAAQDLRPTVAWAIRLQAPDVMWIGPLWHRPFVEKLGHLPRKQFVNDCTVFAHLGLGQLYYVCGMANTGGSL